MAEVEGILLLEKVGDGSGRATSGWDDQLDLEARQAREPRVGGGDASAMDGGHADDERKIGQCHTRGNVAARTRDRPVAGTRGQRACVRSPAGGGLARPCA